MSFIVQNTDGGKADALLYVFLVGANAFVFSWTSYPLSDIPFMAAALFCLALCNPRNGFTTRTQSIVLLAAGAGSAFLFRNAGAALILAGLIYLLLGRQRKQFYLYVFVVGCLILPWVLWQAMHGSVVVENPLLAYYQSYESPAFFLAGSDPGLAVQIIGANLLYSALTVDSMMFLHVLPELRVVTYPLMIWGFWSILRRQTVFFNGFILFYMVLILSWPWHPARYLMPLLPVVLLSLFQGVQAATAIIRPYATKAWSAAIIPFAVRIPIGIVVVLIIGMALELCAHSIAINHLALWGGFRTSYGWTGFSETFSWVKQNTRSDDILATAYDPMYYLYTGRKAVRPWIHRPETYFYPYGNAMPDLGSVEEIRDSSEKLGVRFLIVNPLEGYSERIAAAELFANLLRSYEVQPELVFESSDGLHRIYALPHPPKAGQVPRHSCFFMTHRSELLEIERRQFAARLFDHHCAAAPPMAFPAEAGCPRCRKCCVVGSRLRSQTKHVAPKLVTQNSKVSLRPDLLNRSGSAAEVFCHTKVALASPDLLQMPSARALMKYKLLLRVFAAISLILHVKVTRVIGLFQSFRSTYLVGLK